MKIANYIVTGLIGALILVAAFVHLQEFYIVAITQDLEGYPWGQDKPFWYSSPKTYWVTALVCGSFLSALFLADVFFLLKGWLKQAWILSAVFLGFIALNQLLQRL